MPKSKLKPSEWIYKKAVDLEFEWHVPHQMALIKSILNYLDQQEDNAMTNGKII